MFETVRQDQGVTEPETTPTVRDRMLTAGIPEERINMHLAAGRIRLDGERVDDLTLAAAPPSRVTVAGS